MGTGEAAGWERTPSPPPPPGRTRGRGARCQPPSPAQRSWGRRERPGTRSVPSRLLALPLPAGTAPSLHRGSSPAVRPRTTAPQTAGSGPQPGGSGSTPAARPALAPGEGGRRKGERGGGGGRSRLTF